MWKCLWSRTAPQTVLETMRKASKTAVTRKRKAFRVHLQLLRDDGWQHVMDGPGTSEARIQFDNISPACGCNHFFMGFFPLIAPSQKWSSGQLQFL